MKERPKISEAGQNTAKQRQKAARSGQTRPGCAESGQAPKHAKPVGTNTYRITRGANSYIPEIVIVMLALSLVVLLCAFAYDVWLHVQQY